MSLTRQQRRLRKEIEDICSLIGTDFWNIEEYSSRTGLLELIKDKLIRSEVIITYTLLDEFLTDIICDFYFPRKKGELHYGRLWKTKRFRLFVHFIMDETFLLKKLAIVNAIKAIPKDVSSALARINDTRNALAHAFFPQNRRRYVAEKKVIHNGAHLFTPKGVQHFQRDADLAYKYLEKQVPGASLLTLRVPSADQKVTITATPSRATARRQRRRAQTSSE